MNTNTYRFCITRDGEDFLLTEGDSPWLREATGSYDSIEGCVKGITHFSNERFDAVSVGDAEYHAATELDPECWSVDVEVEEQGFSSAMLTPADVIGLEARQ